MAGRGRKYTLSAAVMPYVRIIPKNVKLGILAVIVSIRS
jgi:hypothetical protein